MFDIPLPIYFFTKEYSLKTSNERKHIPWSSLENYTSNNTTQYDTTQHETTWAQHDTSRVQHKYKTT